MWIQLMYGKASDIILKLNNLAEEKEILLEISTGPARKQLVNEIGLIRGASGSLRELNIMREAYEEMLGVMWKYDRRSTEDILLQRNHEQGDK